MAKNGSVDQALREVIREEIAAELEPLRALIEQVQQSSGQLAMLTQLAERLAPLLGVGVAAPRAGATKRRGRPPGTKNAPKRALVSGAAASSGGGRRGPKPVNNRPCAVRECGRPARTKGYCAAHYQKLRMLARTNRLPEDWKDFAEASSVDDVVLPRGRAASKALKENNS